MNMDPPRFKIPPSEHFTASVTQRNDFEVFRILKTKLTDAQKKRLKRICFGHIINLDLRFQGHFVHGVLLREIEINNANLMEIWFHVAGHSIRMSHKEFGLISGLRFGPIPLPSDYTFTSHRLRDKYFGNTNQVTLVDLKACLKNLDFTHMDEDEDDKNDAIKLALIFILELSLDGRDKRQSMDLWHLQLVDDLKAFNAYSWGTYIWARTCKSLRQALAGRLLKYLERLQQKQGHHEEKYGILGCPFFFQIWAYEAIPDAAKLFSVQRSLRCRPRFRNWTTRCTTRFEDVEKILSAAKHNEQPRMQLTARRKEFPTDWYQSILQYQPSNGDYYCAVREKMKVKGISKRRGIPLPHSATATKTEGVDQETYDIPTRHDTTGTYIAPDWAQALLLQQSQLCQQMGAWRQEHSANYQHICSRISIIEQQIAYLSELWTTSKVEVDGSPSVHQDNDKRNGAFRQSPMDIADTSCETLGKPCDICGDVGFQECMVTCDQCKVACQHVYCMHHNSFMTPEAWFCEDCSLSCHFSSSINS